MELCLFNKILCGMANIVVLDQTPFRSNQIWDTTIYRTNFVAKVCIQSFRIITKAK